jgi:DNA processing protein
MAAGGRTWAVLGSGLDCVYPLENKPLADEIVVRGGCVISEYPPREGPLAWKFPRRNRIVSGLSWAVIVVEGGEKSGALITARTASEQGRDVFAVPGPVDSPMSAAPHRLLRNGAGLLRRAEDVMAEIPALRNCRIDGVSPIKEESFTLDEEKILQLLGSENLALEALVTASALPLPRLLDILTGLEARGIISALPGQNYGRI